MWIKESEYKCICFLFAKLGYPLDSIAIVPEYDKYLAELTSEEKNKNDKKNNEDDVIKFITENLNSNNSAVN